MSESLFTTPVDIALLAEADTQGIFRFCQNSPNCATDNKRCSFIDCFVVHLVGMSMEWPPTTAAHWMSEVYKPCLENLRGDVNPADTFQPSEETKYREIERDLAGSLKLQSRALDYLHQTRLDIPTTNAEQNQGNRAISGQLANEITNQCQRSSEFWRNAYKTWLKARL
ncbi:hypothetical protein CC1G_15519 [Coprinopsis cinerea okayama7|uniref:Uncharacterized protein n=1 Tax=Coprinopsis cinerea (strain Okayama-7 / 130 / ATCC MYA-4618 / FGSC 9003) TaxID=240176 RepID=D6RNA0_COPC7|nr:hypothetical protein CC1G_15519 [Coprinopsis cinerea okayama7\|eukprot:XP_002910978.1 hypothetical protein CC1G_15519 [Coprinopsis cinerea okayama7\